MIIRRKSKANIEKEIKKYDAQIKVMGKYYEVTQEEANRLRKEADSFGMSSIDMQMRRAANATSRRFLDIIASELETLSVEAKTAPRVTVLKKAEVPTVPGIPNQ